MVASALGVVNPLGATALTVLVVTFAPGVNRTLTLFAPLLNTAAGGLIVPALLLPSVTFTDGLNPPRTACGVSGANVEEFNWYDKTVTVAEFEPCNVAKS